MANPVYHVYVDWTCSDFAGVHDFTTAGEPTRDITNDVKHLRISRGKDKDSNTYPAATLEMVLENSSGKYYPTATSGEYVGHVRLWLPVKVTAVYATVTYPLYYGYINRITAYPIKSKQEIYFYATDGIDLLAKTIVTQDMDHKVVINDGEATSSVLNAASWKTVDVACTMQNVGDTVTAASHGLSDGDKVMFKGSMPAALDTYITYYVVTSTTHTFQVALTAGGAPIEFAGDGSGYYHEILRRTIDVDGGDITNFPNTYEFTVA
jgi:hypothetical protein